MAIKFSHPNNEKTNPPQPTRKKEPEKTVVNLTSGKRKQVVSIRLDEAVIEAWKNNTSMYTSAMVETLTEHAITEGWLK